MDTPVSKILSLPEELLAHIVGLVVSYPARSWWAPDFDKFFRDAVSVMRVCRRFWRLAILYLYRYVDVAIGRVGPSFPAASPKGTEHLHRTLSRDTSLREYCRVLHIYIGEYDGELPKKTMQDFAIWLAGTRSLLIDYVQPAVQTAHHLNQAWDVTRAAVHSMASLEDITLTTGSDLLTLPAITETLRDAACLRAVNLNGVSYAGLTLPWKDFKVHPPLVQLYLAGYYGRLTSRPPR